MATDYKSAGVDIEAGDEAVRRIKGTVKSTFTENVLSDIGLFGAFFKFDQKKYKEPVLVSSVDGVGTKLMVAIDSGIHNTIGQDLVNHCVNDIAVCGAEPLFFMDYLAFGKLNPDVMEQIVIGFATSCRENGCSLVGGETAEMPGLYSQSHYDLSGTIVGVVEKEEIINGAGIQKGDKLFGFPSSGLHTNGYSLARKVLLDKYRIDDFIPELGCKLYEELLKVHKSYLPLIRSLKKELQIKGLSHITGGGIEGNTSRILRENFKLSIDWKSWEPSPVFKLIQKTGDIPDEEMRKVFNLGIGLIAVIGKEDEPLLRAWAEKTGETAYYLGEII